MKKSAARLLLLLVAAATLVAALVWATPKLMRRFYTHGLTVVPVATGLDTPWAFVFLPDGRMLVTERPGRMRIVERDGRLGAPLAGLPPVWSQGEGGLMDVVLDPDFPHNQRVYWSFSEPDASNAALASTAVARGRLAGEQLSEVQVIYRQPVKTGDSRHFGSRLLFDRAGHLFVGLGDRFQRDDAQRLGSAHGKILRLWPDGRAPADNPFAGTPGALPEVWSYGHRNVQGLAIHPQTGQLWASEHGPRGGDELNLIQPGRNHGWPVITYGCEYKGCAPIGEGMAKAGMEQPVLWWGPESTPPSALLFVTSDRYPGWKGQLLVATFRNGAFTRVTLDGQRVVAKDAVYLAGNERVRDLKQGPDGLIYLLANVPEGRILRLEP
ncbi:PQQ-dependent sugar dehydrogenase [Ideonella sp. BN130291]|uniref:PQQ-dependent sugar dehydrogenase n=1 Tax=Ideonella sp. BN130291 TaxID=3112940 RepID=UPI002E259913|nr:PQQ-dependent sugar dehydrogenase [Ideonella sp. BN130291]